MSQERQPQHRKIITMSRENRGPANNLPDTPRDDVTHLRKLGRRYPAHIDIPFSESDSVETIIKDFGRGPAEGQRIVPSTVNPRLDAQFVDVRGGRVIGGGTSKEATRTAKKKQKNQAKKERRLNLD
jgi:hypothetical protein